MTTRYLTDKDDSAYGVALRNAIRCAVNPRKLGGVYKGVDIDSEDETVDGPLKISVRYVLVNGREETDVIIVDRGLWQRGLHQALLELPK